VPLAFGAMYSSGIKNHNRQLGKVGKYQRGKLGTVAVRLFVCLMVLNTTFNNISAISWQFISQIVVMNLDKISFKVFFISLKTALVGQRLACSPRVNPRSIESNKQLMQLLFTASTLST
jgi:hypothetical protein